MAVDRNEVIRLDRLGQNRLALALARSSDDIAVKAQALPILAELEIEDPVLAAEILASNHVEALYQSSLYYFDVGQYHLASAKIEDFLAGQLTPVEFLRGLHHKVDVKVALGMIARSKHCAVFGHIQDLSAQAHSTECDYRLLNRQGMLAFFDGHLEESLEFFSQAENLMVADGHLASLELAGLYFKLGLVHRDLWGYSKAIEWFNKCLAICEKRQNKTLQLRCWREMFFCYWQQGDADQARIVFFNFKQQSTLTIHDVEVLILHAYLVALNCRFALARQKLLMAYALARRNKLGRHHFGIHFHLTRLYIHWQQKRQAQAWLNRLQDPVYKMQLLWERIENERFKANVEGTKQFVELSRQTGSAFYQDLAKQLIAGESKTRVIVDFSRGCIRAKGNTVQFSDSSTIAAFCQVLRRGIPRFDKEFLLKEIFGFRYYDSAIHDSKIYKFVHELNTLLNCKILIAHAKNYILNPDVALLIFGHEKVVGEIFLVPIVKQQLQEDQRPQINRISARTGLTRQQVRKALVTLKA